ncbi:Nuclear transport factor 2 (NTF2) family protein with RNA binding (RRM-RBD-RNP motifs) domain [Zea mays]|uniref:Nuclear transport factor 2 (NTF2) family protein with RNA binding (RRM-RBD-RNP motifs) domain n=1 Tax=Zea mays TaxID=4577 RepID=B4FWN0_MAIZE|nr:unknown [Zea mays]ACN27424.1 unknown [Zea mays]ONM59449.1 Nuclear transport factor 2 (NTF2) family protein with RNA binding (RRM-RBD-RNP motifs) domain [Zea mays]ONM59450.1 Nuclear transport factor 2 (NTF2) family protein with RNA binding (RRM-RBD-RNP motifs) domain [Zea mays]
MALEDGSPATFTPQVIANAFVKQYYQTLRYAREDAYKFYNDKSILGRTDSNGKMICVTTIDDIKEQLVSTDCADCLIEIETVDAQPSHVDGVIILVAGYFTTAVVKQKFIQSFFLAPQENSGYYVLNDTFRLTGISFEVKVVAANHDNKSTQITTLPNEPEIDSFKESEVPGVPPAGNILVNDGVISTSANVVSPVKNDPVVETCVKVVNEDVVKIPVAAPASTPVTAEEVVNKDFVKIPESAPALPSSVEKAAPAPPASVEKAAAAPPASVEKGAPAPRTPVEKADPAPSAPVEKGAPALRAPVEKADPAPRAPVEKEVTRKTYASVVKIPREDTQPAPAARPSKPNLNIKMVQNTEKNVSSPSKPAHATVNALPGDKGVPKNKSPDEPGYSIFVKNLPFEATVEMVEQEFSKFGAIKSGGVQVKCQPDQFCFGFVEFESQQSMLAAIEASRVYFGTRESYVEEKRTKTRVVDGVITRGDDNGNGGGGRFHSGRGGGYYGDGYKRQWGGQNNGYYNGADNMRNDYSGRVRGPQGNGHPQNGHGYHQNGHGYYSGNGYQQRRPNSNGNGLRVERNNGFRQQGPASA